MRGLVFVFSALGCLGLAGRLRTAGRLRALLAPTFLFATGVLSVRIFVYGLRLFVRAPRE